MQPPVIPHLTRLIATHPGTISLGQGVVRHTPPPQARRRLQGFFDDPRNHLYQPDEGIGELRESLARKLERENGIPSRGTSILVTAGGNMAFLNTLLAISDPGDEVIVLRPWYFNHEMAIRLVGCEPVPVATDARYQPDVDAIARALTPRTRAVVTVSPNNPTGAVYPREALAAINRLCAGHGIWHVSDEAYEYFVHGGSEHFSPASLQGAERHTISLFSFSKAYGLAGWRVGYAVVPESLAEAMLKVQDTNVICAPVVSQQVALGCLEAGREWCRARVRDMARMRDLVWEALAGLGEALEAPLPGGAFFVYVRLATDQDDMTVVERLVREHGVAVVPGSTFGAEGGCHLRISYGALDEATIREGTRRLTRGLAALAGERAGRG